MIGVTRQAFQKFIFITNQQMVAIQKSSIFIIWHFSRSSFLQNEKKNHFRDIRLKVNVIFAQPPPWPKMHKLICSLVSIVFQKVDRTSVCFDIAGSFGFDLCWSRHTNTLQNGTCCTLRLALRVKVVKVAFLKTRVNNGEWYHQGCDVQCN